MDNMTTTLIVVFTLLDFWMIFQIVNQFREIKVNCRFWGAVRWTIVIAFVVCLMILFTGMNDQTNMVLMFVMTLLVVLLFCQRDGAGNRGLIKTGVFVPYQEILRYEISKKDNSFELIVAYKEQARKDQYEGQMKLLFDNSKEKEVKELLDLHLGKKQARIKKKK